MKVNQIVLENFRQFYGKQTLNISTEPEQNVTLILAENGVGKTTLLNSILWCLFEEHTSRFADSDKILSYAAEAEGKRRANVTVQFTHDTSVYEAERMYFHDKMIGQRTRAMIYRREGADRKVINTPESFLNQVLPKGMAPYFFFDGEHAETFGGAESRPRVRKAMSTILGCDLIDAAIDDVEFLARSTAQEISRSGAGLKSGNQERATALQEEIDKYSAIEISAAANVQKVEDEVAVLKARLDEFSAQLIDIRLVEELERRRTGLKQDIRTIDSNIKSIEGDRASWLRENLRPLVSQSLLRTLKGRVTAVEAEDEEKPPPRLEGLTDTLVNAVLTKGECICGRSVKDGGKEHKHLAQMIAVATNSLKDMRLRDISKQAMRISQLATKAPARFIDLEKRRAVADENRRKKEHELSEVETRIDNTDAASVRMIQAERNRVEKEYDSRKELLGKFKTQRDMAYQTRRKREAELNELDSLQESAREPRMMRELFQKARDALVERRNGVVEGARKEIASKVNAIMERTTRRAYSFELDDSLAMTLRFTSSRKEVPRSTGENQLMTLLFTAALIDHAKQRIGQKSQLYIPGAVAPLILDSPFGNLDTTYRAAVAREIPEMAEQVVLFLSSSQATSDVVDQLRARIGRVYLLRLHNPEPLGRRKAEHLFWGKQKLPLAEYDAERSMTEIVEVSP